MSANGANGTVDLRGEFIRGWDGGRGVDSGRALASWQAGSRIKGDAGVAGMGYEGTVYDVGGTRVENPDDATQYSYGYYSIQGFGIEGAYNIYLRHHAIRPRMRCRHKSLFLTASTKSFQ